METYLLLNNTKSFTYKTAKDMIHFMCMEDYKLKLTRYLDFAPHYFVIYPRFNSFRNCSHR